MTVLSAARLPDGRQIDLKLAVGSILEVAPAGALMGEDYSGYVLMPGLVEPHAHLDKALTAETIPNPTGDLMGAIQAWRAAWPSITAADISARAAAAIESYVQHGATTIRSHVNVGGESGITSLRAVQRARDDYADVARVELVALIDFPLTGEEGAANRVALTEAIDAGVEVIGGVPSIDPDHLGHLHVVLDAAAEAGLPVDLHIDETTDSDMLVLAELPDEVDRRDLSGRVTASHCVSLGMQSPAVQVEVATALAAAGISVVANPQSNLYLQAWDTPTAPPRGLTAVESLVAAGVNVAAGGDNMQDPFNPMGRGDPLEAANLMVTAGHLLPGAALEAVSNAGRRTLGLPGVSFEAGDPADFTAVRSPSVREALATGGSGRRVFHAGELVAEIDVTRRLHRT